MVYADVGNLMEEFFGLFGILVNPSLAVLEQLCSTSFNHITEQCPGGAAEANQRDPTRQFLSGQGNTIIHIAQFFGHINMTVKNLLILPIGRRLKWIGEVRTLFVDHFNCHAHGLGNYKDVGKYDGGIEKASVALNGLQRQGRSNFGISAAFEEITATLCLVILGKITTSYESFSLVISMIESSCLPCRITHMGGRSTTSPTCQKEPG